MEKLAWIAQVDPLGTSQVKREAGGSEWTEVEVRMLWGHETRNLGRCWALEEGVTWTFP